MVRFYNFHFLANHSVSFVMEFMANGSLKKRLNELEADKVIMTACLTDLEAGFSPGVKLPLQIRTGAADIRWVKPGS